MIYLHRCFDKDCNYEFELEYSMKDDPPTLCPQCNKHTVKRPIVCHAKGIVELSGRDFTDYTTEETKKLAKEMRHNEKLYANVLNPTKYHEMQTQMDRRKRK